MWKKILCTCFFVIVYSGAWATQFDSDVRTNFGQNIPIPNPEHFYNACQIQIAQKIPFGERKPIHWQSCIHHARAKSVAAFYKIPLEQANLLVPF